MKSKIRDIVDVATGYQFRGKVEPVEDGNVSVIQIKDIDERRTVRLDDLVCVRLERPDAHLVQQGDVLFLSRGQRQYAVVISSPVKDTIATGFFFVLRSYARRVRPEFLAWSLNQPEFQELLRPITRGSHMPLVSKTDFQNLMIELPTLAVQDRILHLQQLFDHEQELAAALQSKRAQLVHAISHELLAGRLQIQDSTDDE